MKMFRNLEMVVDLNSSELHLFRIDREGNRNSAANDPMKADLLSTIREVGGVAFIQGRDAIEVLYGTMTGFVIRQQPMHPMQTMITDLEALAMAYNYPLSGVLGFDFFQKGIVRINLVKKELGLRLVQEAAL